jgi:type IV pilus assembly protein PilO
MTFSRVLSEKRRIVVPLGIAILANVLLYAVVVFPLGRQVVSAEAEANRQHDLLNKARVDHRAARATVTGKQQADAALQQFYKAVLPPSASAARTLTYARLSQLAEQTAVRLEQGANTVDREKGSALAKSTTSYTLSGDYRNVRRFIYALETTPEFVILENVTLNSPGEQAAGRDLAMRLEIATYYRSTHDGN